MRESPPVDAVPNPAEDHLPQRSVLTIDGLAVDIKVRGQWVTALDDLSLEVMGNETVALVGESGSGKTLTALSAIRLLPPGMSRVVRGSIRVGGRDILDLSESQIEDVRGRDVAMIFQDPMSSLNPLLPIGEQVAEVMRRHLGHSRAKARARAIELLTELRIPDAAQRYDLLPHELSGGQRQRVMIAAALAANPRLIIADEPTTALDVTIQAQILLLMEDMRRQRGTAILFITHNLAVVATIAHRVAVMYGGQIVEIGPTRALFSDPRHPYTEGLLSSVPRHDRDSLVVRAIPGSVPPLDQMPRGCRFAPRCSARIDRCVTEAPRLVPVAPGSAHSARCWVRAP